MAIDFFSWGNPVEVETRRRIRLCAWAYAYEIDEAPLVDDATFDREALLSDKTITTGRYDQWWHDEFDPSTGLWIYSHPDLEKVGKYVWRLKHPADYQQMVNTALQQLQQRIKSALP